MNGIGIAIINGFSVNIIPIAEESGVNVEFPANFFRGFDPILKTYLLVKDGLEIYRKAKKDCSCNTIELPKHMIRPYIMCDVLSIANQINVPTTLVIVKKDGQIYDLSKFCHMFSIKMDEEEEDKERRIMRTLPGVLYNNKIDPDNDIVEEYHFLLSHFQEN
jgi:hypothetical protein